MLTAPTTSRPAGWDTDNDGMPNAWEIAHGLNPNTASPDADFDNDGYINVVEYLNEAGAFPAPRAIALDRRRGRPLCAERQLGHVAAVAVRHGEREHRQGDRRRRRPARRQPEDRPGRSTAAEVEVTGGWLDVADARRRRRRPARAARARSASPAGRSPSAPRSNLNSTGTLVLGGGTLALNAAAPFNWNGGTLQTTVEPGHRPERDHRPRRRDARHDRQDRHLLRQPRRPRRLHQDRRRHGHAHRRQHLHRRHDRERRHARSEADAREQRREHHRRHAQGAGQRPDAARHTPSPATTRSSAGPAR